jgi:hypothetical protein
MKKTLTVLLCVCSLALLQNCGSSKKATSKKMAVSFEKDVMPIMQASCTPCHFPPDGRKKPLNNYDAVKANIVDVIARVKLPHDAKGFMPWQSKKPPLTDSAINVLVEWQKQNMPN